MHIRKYGPDFGRRELMKKTAQGTASVGVLSSMWPMIAKSASPNIKMAYTDDLYSLEAQTKGKVNTGDVIDASNIEYVKHLVDPITYHEVSTDGRKIYTRAPTTEITELMEDPYLESTISNWGKNITDKNGQAWRGQVGQPINGGLPFPEPKDAIQAQSNLNYSWGRHNYSQYAVPDTDLGPNGDIQYQYELVWCELQVTARPDGTIWDGRKDKLRYQSVFFTSPSATAGTAFLNIWDYDQSKYPELVGYLPAFKRVREYPTKQRFEPLVPGMTIFFTTVWAAGDPMLTWGNYKIIGRQPVLGEVSRSWEYHKDNPNWEPKVHGGPKGQTYYDTYQELVPEAIVIEYEPTGYPRAPVGKRRTWIDARSGEFVRSVEYDRNGKPWRSWEAGFSKYEGKKTALGDTPWSWRWVMCHDIQAGRMSRLYQGKEVTGGYESQWNTSGDEAYDKFLTVQAMQRLGG